MTKERSMATFKVGDRVRLTADRTGTVTAVHAEHGRCNVKAWSDHHRRDVEYLVPDEHLTLADAPAPTGPRYVVRAASEMREGEPYLDSCSDRSTMVRDAYRFNAGPDTPGGEVLTRSEWTEEWVLIDTRPDSPAPVEPPRPSDAEVCRAWEAVANWRETCRDPDASPPYGYTSDGRGLLTVGVGPTETTRADYQAARSRELKRLAAASAETERLRVVVQCQDGGADDV